MVYIISFDPLDPLLKGGHYYGNNSHFTERETEAQRGYVCVPNLTPAK